MMKSILLIGLGNFGQQVAAKLSELNHQVMAIDQQEERVNEVLPYVTNAQIGDSTNREFLCSLGINDYDVCIVTIASNFQNSLETTSLLKELGAKYVVSRAEREVQEKFLLRNGADEVINPEKQVAHWTAIRYSSDHILDFVELDDDYAIFELLVPDHWVGHTVGQLDIRKKHNINLMAIKRQGEMTLTVQADTVLEEGQSLLVLGSQKDIQKCFRT